MLGDAGGVGDFMRAADGDLAGGVDEEAAAAILAAKADLCAVKIVPIVEAIGE